MKAVSTADVVTVRIDQVVIGQRRRQTLGRLQLLAKSIEAHGLIHPILLRGDVLVAGHRRLEACRLLRWTSIPARQVERLSDDELRAIELDENTARENLSDFAASKQRLAEIRQAEADLKAQAAISGTARTEKSTSGRGRPKGRTPGSKNDIAEVTGISKPEQRRIERHVELAERYPFMQRSGWNRTQVLDAGDQIERIPEPERAPLVVALDEPGIPPRTAIAMLTHTAEMPAAARRKVVAKAQSHDEFERREARTMMAATPPPPDPGLLALSDGVEALKRATSTCRSPVFKGRIEAAWHGVTKLRDRFRAHEKEARANGSIA